MVGARALGYPQSPSGARRPALGGAQNYVGAFLFVTAHQGGKKPGILSTLCCEDSPTPGRTVAGTKGTKTNRNLQTLFLLRAACSSFASHVLVSVTSLGICLEFTDV